MLGWEKYIVQKDKTISIDQFGASAPTGKIYKEFGLIVDNIISTAIALYIKFKIEFLHCEITKYLEFYEIEFLIVDYINS